MFAASRHKTNGARSALQVSNESPGDAFLGKPLGLFLTRSDLHDRSRYALGTGLASEQVVFFGVYILDMDFGREIGVLIQRVFRLLESRRPVEVIDRCGFFQAFE